MHSPAASLAVRVARRAHTASASRRPPCLYSMDSILISYVGVVLEAAALLLEAPHPQAAALAVVTRAVTRAPTSRATAFAPSRTCPGGAPAPPSSGRLRRRPYVSYELRVIAWRARARGARRVRCPAVIIYILHQNSQRQKTACALFFVPGYSQNPIFKLFCF